MLKSVSAAVAAAVMLSAGAASAANISPIETNVTLVTQITTSQGVNLDCTRGDRGGRTRENGNYDSVRVSSTGSSLGSGSSFCDNVTFTSDWIAVTLAYNPTGLGSAPLEVTGINVNTAMGSCTQGAAAMSGAWFNASPAGYGVVSGSLPGVILTFSAPCAFNAHITSTPNLVVS